MKNGNYCDCNRKNAIKFGGFKKSCTFANQKDVYPKFSLACAFRRGRASQGGGASSALLHNTIALLIPNAKEKSRFFC